MLDAYYHEAHSMSIVAQHRKSIDFPYFLCSILPEAIREALKKQSVSKAWVLSILYVMYEYNT